MGGSCCANWEATWAALKIPGQAWADDVDGKMVLVPTALGGAHRLYLRGEHQGHGTPISDCNPLVQPTHSSMLAVPSVGRVLPAARTEIAARSSTECAAARNAQPRTGVGWRPSNRCGSTCSQAQTRNTPPWHVLGTPTRRSIGRSTVGSLRLRCPLICRCTAAGMGNLAVGSVATIRRT